MIYVDSSALITLIARRPLAGELEVFLGAHLGRPLVTNTIGFVETVRILDRIGDFPGAMARLTADHAEVTLTPQIRDAAASLPGNIRSLDAIHVASALQLGSALDVLISYDARMLEVARAAGLPTAAPGVT